MSFPRPIQRYRSHADLIWPTLSLSKLIQCQIFPQIDLFFDNYS